jgi:primosomal protein N' (replication factor Y)
VAGVVWDGGEAVDREEAAADHRGLRLSADLRTTCAASSTGSPTYTLSPPGAGGAHALRAPEAFDPEPWIAGLKLCTDVEPDRMTDARGARAGTGRGRLAWTRSGLAHAAGVSPPSSTGCRAGRVSRRR